MLPGGDAARQRRGLPGHDPASAGVLAALGLAPVPPPLYDAVWYGDGDLWTLLDLNGANWSVNDDGRLTLKQFWFSTAFDWHEEPEPALHRVHRQLDGPGLTELPGPVTHGIRPRGELHEFMISGGSLTPGCWEIGATYRGASLSFVVLVAAYEAP
ncbi:MAG: hypothetical protein O3A10_00605 [Chloroflexi bacterium]|nr:hypothetical protein [Chloroflexota bacterium]MDA1148132.1 hypothetical protein [Chloroflexota bacterium]